jgi:hypothetical protein
MSLPKPTRLSPPYPNPDLAVPFPPEELLYYTRVNHTSLVSPAPGKSQPQSARPDRFRQFRAFHLLLSWMK